jgi:hypothetical protein
VKPEKIVIEVLMKGDEMIRILSKILRGSFIGTR